MERTRRVRALALALCVTAALAGCSAPTEHSDAALDARADVARDVASDRAAVDGAAPDVAAVDGAAPDVAAPDVATPDVPAPDVTVVDAPPDAVAMDAPPPDVVATDAPAMDVPAVDTSGMDAPVVDVSPLEAAADVPPVDAGPCDADVSSDPNNCGACGVICRNVPGAVGSCRAGRCQYACQEGYADCDGDLASPATDGCEAHLATDPMHCGSCAMRCATSVPGAAAGCVAGRCSVECAPNRGDCNGDRFLAGGGDGCETDLTSSAANCGECNHPCVTACSASLCVGELQPCQLFPVEAANPIAPVLATDGTRFAVAWVDFDNGGLWIARLGATGRVEVAPRRVASVVSWARYDLGFDGTDFVLAWTDPGTFNAQRFAPDTLVPAAPVYTESTGTSSTTIVRVGSRAGSVLIVYGGLGARLWSAGAATPAAAHALTIGALAPVGSSIAVAGTTTGFLLAWQTTVHDALMMRDVPAAAYIALDASGAPVGTATSDRPPLAVPLASMYYTLAFASQGDGATLVLHDGFRVHDRRLDASAAPTGAWVDPLTVLPGVAAASPAASSLAFTEGTGNTQFDVVRLGPTGAAAGATVHVATLGAPPAAVLASNAMGTLVVWSRWLNDSSTRSHHRLEAMFISGDTTVVRPCD